MQGILQASIYASGPLTPIAVSKAFRAALFSGLFQNSDNVFILLFHLWPSHTSKCRLRPRLCPATPRLFLPPPGPTFCPRHVLLIIPPLPSRYKTHWRCYLHQQSRRHIWTSLDQAKHRGCSSRVRPDLCQRKASFYKNLYTTIDVTYYYKTPCAIPQSDYLYTPT